MSATGHTLAAAVLAAGEPSKVPFYVFGACLAAWAVVLAAIGLTQPDFPGSAARARMVMATSALLVLGTVVSAVATSSKHHEEAEAAGGEAGGGAKVEVAADPSGQLKFDTNSLKARAGRVTIQFTNRSPVTHNVRIEGGGNPNLGGTNTVSNGTATATVDLRPGSYTFYCSVDGHRQAGMQGKLTVS